MKRIANLFSGLFNQIDPKFGFVDVDGRMVYKPKNITDLLKYVRQADAECLKINMHSGRIRLMLQKMDAEYLFDNAKEIIQEKRAYEKFKESNPQLF